MTDGTECGCGKTASIRAWRGDDIPRILLCDECYPGDEEWFEGSDCSIRPAERIK